MPQEFLTTPERLRYQTVPASLLEVDIRQHFHLTEADRTFLTPFRGAANRLGLALQLGVLRLMGFLPEAWASQLPPEAVAFVATQLATEMTHLERIRIGINFGHGYDPRIYHFGHVMGPA